MNTNKSCENIHFFFNEKEKEKEKDDDKILRHSFDVDNNNNNDNDNDEDTMSTSSSSSPLNNDCLVNIEQLMYNFEQVSANLNKLQCSAQYVHDDYATGLINHYNDNYNVKELLKICEYYGINKTVNKSKKMEIVYFIIIFENAGENCPVVMKRKQMWHYMDELKQDKFMKKHVIW